MSENATDEELGAILGLLARTLEERKLSTTEKSYVASLYAGGDDSILKKVGEEAIEVVLAAKGSGAGENPDTTHLVREVADLWFHVLVLLAHKGLGPADVLRELESRFNQSGLDEKAARNNIED